MKTTVLKYGSYSGIAILVLFTISFLFLTDLSFGMQEVFGYLSIFIALAFVFFGIKSYRDEQPEGKLSFGKAFGLGILIVLVPSIIFGAFNVFYVVYLNPEFYDQYYGQMITDLSTQYSGAELTVKITELEDMKDMASSNLFTFILMFLTVFLLGFIVSLISAMTLRKG